MIYTDEQIDIGVAVMGDGYVTTWNEVNEPYWAEPVPPQILFQRLYVVNWASPVQSIYVQRYKSGELYAQYAGEKPGTVRNWDILFAGWGMELPWSNCTIVEQTEKRLVCRVIRCGVGETFLAVRPPLDIARMYCDIDFGTFDALFGKDNIRAERPKWIPEGNPYCEYTIEFKE